MEESPTTGILRQTRELINPGRVDWLEAVGMDMVMERREGCYYWDRDGRRYFDALCDGTTFNFGHRHPRLVTCLREALDELDVGCQFLASEARADLAAELLASAPPGLGKVHFLPSGSEANDAAIKSAFEATGRRKIVSIRGAFHGVTGLAGRATAGPFGWAYDMAGAAAEWQQVPWNDPQAMARELEKGDVAAVLLEPMPFTLGWVPPQDDYMQELRENCSRHGTLLIIDEVQTGLGRCGTVWACEQLGIEPDILVMAKGAGGGLYPLAYILMNEHAARWTKTHPLTMPSTFGGSELGCRVGLEVIRMASEPAFLQQVREVSEVFGEQLAGLQSNHPEHLLEVRRWGLAIALQFSDPMGGLHMMSALCRRGVLSIVASAAPSTLLLKPPLVTSPEQVEEVTSALQAAMSDYFVDGGRSVDLDAAALPGV